ncbi:alpha/beta hydrolase [Nocardioides sp. B-3]|uniref:alpha/beta hydrolase n=1 Tax=Nocardioides sp. B-3 TaxID=2895565 RepID=UPI0021525759|nr:alpha/beta hydrolase [Nocardioides sp. B-3]UUZ57617.1 alpha/beta hydrolase [Nocardioides sp. B-3]
MKIIDTVEALTAKSLLALPERIQRRLAGRPVVLDGQTLATETQLLLRLQRVAREPAVESLPIPEGRTALLKQSLPVGGTQPVGRVRDEKVTGLPARLYEPTGAPAVGPMLVFFHGGGWIYGDLDSHDAVCRVLAERAGVRVLALDYTLSPEVVFPSAYDECVRAYAEIVERADEWGADRTRLAVGGDSAGGNLAAGVAIEAARQGWPCAFQLLVYPLTDATGAAQSRKTFASGFYLTAEFIAPARANYAPDARTRTDPRVSPLYADLPAGLAPALVVTAGFDPLRDEGEAYAERLRGGRCRGGTGPFRQLDPRVLEHGRRRARDRASGCPDRRRVEGGLGRLRR